MNFKLTNYLDEIEQAYSRARLGYTEIVESLEELKERHDARINHGMLNDEGLMIENNTYHERKKALEKEFEKIRDRFTNEVNDIRKREDSVFKSKYTANASDIDLKAVEMLKSGMLTGAEIMEMARTYSDNGNNAMYRYCGTFLNPHSKNLEERVIAEEAKKAYQRPDTEIVNEFVDICNRGLRNDIAASNGIHNRHDEFKDMIYLPAQDIEVESE